MFIAIEGTDGCGKTTIRKHLHHTLRENGADVLTLQGQSWLNPRSTEVITNAKYHRMPYPAEVILSAMVEEKEAMSDRIVLPHRPWRYIISDRYTLSDVVYGAELWGIPVESTLRAFVDSRVVQPDLVLFIDTPVDIAWRRLNERPKANRHPWDVQQVQRRLYELFQDSLERYRALAPVVRVDNSGVLADTLGRLPAVTPPRSAPGAIAGKEQSR
ncbi:thymidylate kinase [Spirillospora sp. NBC_00431]